MIVCLCRNVSDRDIVMAVRSGIRSFGALRDELTVGMSCGYCQDSAREIFETALRKAPSGAAEPGEACPD